MLEENEMKNIACLTIIAFALAICGCKSDKFITIDTETNSPTQCTSSFNDEYYIWESWLYSTNQVIEVK